MGLLCFHKFTWNQEIFSSKHNYCILEMMLHQNMHIFFYKDDDDEELLLQNDWPTKGVKSYFQPGPLSEILTIVNLWHAVNKIWTCTEAEFKLCQMKLCSSDNHYNLALDFWSCHLSTIKSWICSSETLTW